MQSTAEYRDFLKKKMGWKNFEQPGSELRDTDEYEERVYARDQRHVCWRRRTRFCATASADLRGSEHNSSDIGCNSVGANLS
jgi:hypothetical protein